MHPRIFPHQLAVPTTQTATIKDFDIIKLISKGAFGSVFLAKKKATGDYFAIKVLKKVDMIAKNQIACDEAEGVSMKQAESPFVAKLYFTFQSKDNLYLMMEYLNGGDCAALIKSLGCLPEEWTKNYIAEVVLGLEYLHQRGIIHRNLKPDNLLIDQHGHLKLTDFGLSRIGLFRRPHNLARHGGLHTGHDSRLGPPSMDLSHVSSLSMDVYDPLIAPTGGDISKLSGSKFTPALYAPHNRVNNSPLQSFATELTEDLRSALDANYLAPESIFGLWGDDEAVDWCALGTVTYEFLYGIPPFHAESPERVFENILSGHIEWHEDWVEFTEEAHAYMKDLLTLGPEERLGSNGAEEVKAHPFLAGIDWDKVTTIEAAFIPQVTDPESTDYFDPRGAIPQLLQDDDPTIAQSSESQGSLTVNP